MSSGQMRGLGRKYVRLNLLYTSEAFVYLFAGLLAMLLFILHQFYINPDSIYILWLFGFVVSMVFGITNIMVPSYGNGKEFPSLVVKSELILLNSGTIITFIGFNDYSYPFLAGVGIILLLLAVIIHLIDLSSAGRKLK